LNRKARANLKYVDLEFELEDCDGAIEDYTRAVNLNPNNILAYSYRGSSIAHLEDYNGANADLHVAINIDSSSSLAYYIRGNIKEHIRDIGGIWNDWKTAANIGDIDAEKNAVKYCD
jgi:tetratricopeptide (TPR) repeat protein